MISQTLYRILVPDAPPDRRTQGDVRSEMFEARLKSNNFLRSLRLQPGLQQPSLVSSFSGRIDRILFAWPSKAVADPALAAAYASVIAALRSGTQFVVVHHEGTQPAIAAWFDAAGHAAGNITWVPLPDYVNFTDWAEDAYVSLVDSADGTHYLMEPWEFLRAGDALIADAVEEHSASAASQAPLIFQGGNCLVGEGVWLLGKDYFADSIELTGEQRSPVPLPAGTDPDAFVRQLFARYVDSARRLIVVGTDRPVPIREMNGVREGNSYYLDLAGDGVGTFQPIFHIDMFITLLGPAAGGRPRAMVGSPELADRMLGTNSRWALGPVYDQVAAFLAGEGFDVIRNPLVHHPTSGRSFTLAELRAMAQQPGNEAVGPAIADLTAAGAGPNTSVTVRTWHHITWNNCLVEDSAQEGPQVYLPTFGHGQYAHLAAIDDHMRQMWEGLGYRVHLLGDFNPFAERQGVVHCIKKYLARGG